MNLWPLAVVGAGPAGIAAASEAARLGIRPLLLDATGRAGGTIGIAHEVRNIPFLRDGVSGDAVVEHLEEYLIRWNVSVRRERVERISPVSDGVLLETVDGARVVASRLVLATGTEPLFPDIEGLARGSYLEGSARAACADRIPTHALVIGGSDVAMDQARWLRAKGSQVEVLARGQVRAPAWLADAARREGVVLHCEARVLGADVQAGRVAVTIRCGQQEMRRIVDVVVSAMGRRPVMVDGAREAMGALPDRIRVVGDGTGRRARHVVAALGDGCVAAAELLARSAGGSK